MWKFLQSDKNGNPSRFEDGMQVVTQFTCPPLLPQKNITWGQKLTTTGLSSGSDDMGINGSVTPVEFYVQADQGPAGVWLHPTFATGNNANLVSVLYILDGFRYQQAAPPTAVV